MMLFSKKIGPRIGIFDRIGIGIGLEGARVVQQIAVGHQELRRHVACEPRGKDVDRNAADDLVDLELDRQDRVHAGQEHAGQDGNQQARPRGCRSRTPTTTAVIAAMQHRAFDTDVDDAGSFADHPAERRQRDGRGAHQGAAEHADQVERLAPSGPGQECQHETERDDRNHRADCAGSRGRVAPRQERRRSPASR